MKKFIYLLVIPFIVLRYQLMFGWIPANYGIDINQETLYTLVTHLYYMALLYIPIYYLVISRKKIGILMMWGLFILLYMIQMNCTNYGKIVFGNPDLYINLVFTIQYLFSRFKLTDEVQRKEYIKKMMLFWVIYSFVVLIGLLIFQKIEWIELLLLLSEFIVLCLWVFLVLWELVNKKLEQKNQENIKLARMEELAKYNAEKLAMMKSIQNDIVATDHRLFYILYQLELCLQNNDYDKAHEVLQKYKDLVTKYKIVVNTGNAIFDTLYSMKINDFIMREIKIENSIFISQNPFYNGFEFTNFVCELLNYFMMCKTLYITMEEINENVILKIIYRDGKIPIEKIDSYLKLYLKKDESYNLSQHELRGIRIMMSMRRDD